MNHRVMFFISLIVIAVGVMGMIVQSGGDSPQVSEEPTVEAKPSSQRTIMLAKAKIELSSGYILGANDYELNEVTVEGNSDLIRLDISALNTGTLRGYLVKSPIKTGSYIESGMLEGPDSPGYILDSLGENEMTYNFPVRLDNSYLLDSLAVGDDVALYLRMLEVSKDSRMKSEVGLESSSGGGAGQSDQYVLSRLISPLTVLSIPPKVEISPSLRSDEIIGFIQLRARTRDLEFIHTVEKAGELLLLPVHGGTEAGKIRLDSLLPQLRTIKQIRG
ncbi:Uncharacterised protein [Pragia fontium]|uniref:hypothetical protein n=1 Tax=Pragia fontium TaxID=82985 RepID=UPI000DFB4F03|nr:hypothetical protein [Pragia fontium]SUB81319.1 Uncharacterised protein [Pragia fontium]